MAGSQVALQSAVYLCLVVTSLAFAVPKKRIVYGQQSLENAHPYMASVAIKVGMAWYPVCGGVLLATNKVLTAAHCVHGKPKADLRVTVGQTDLYGPPTMYVQVSGVKSLVVHEDHVGYDNDIAIIYLSQPVFLNKGVKVPALPPKELTFADSKCAIMGWGRTSNRESGSRVLMEAKINTITTSECKAKFPGSNISADNICVYDTSAGTFHKISGCKGDSGGPLMCGSNFEYVAGILSMGSDICTGSIPTVYMRVTRYLDWIASH